jgi:hypothetical protein
VSEYEGKGRPNYLFQQHARQEEQGWAERPHEDLVMAFRGLIGDHIQNPEKYGFGPNATRYPALVVRRALGEQTRLHMSPDPLDQQRAAYFLQIERAWDAIAYDHYRYRYRGQEYQDSFPKELAGGALSFMYQRAQVLREARPEIIKLDPQQVKILDALAEAADIPHQRGQAEIEIPEKLRYYERHRIGPDGKLIF